MDRFEIMANALFLAFMLAVVWGLMGAEAWLWQLFAYFIGGL